LEKDLGENKMKKLNKKGQEGATLTWIVATLLIFFIMFFFVACVGLIYVRDKSAFQLIFGSDSRITIIDKATKTNLILTENLIYFLNKKVENGESLQEAIINADVSEGKKDRKAIFEKEAKQFIYDNFQITPDFFTLSRARAWVRVYNADEKVKQMGYNWVYQAYEGYISNGYCDPYKKDDAVFISIFIQPNKILAICFNEKK